SLNQQSIDSLAEVGANMEGEFPKLLTDDMLRAATHVVLVGSEAHVEPTEGMTAEIRTWDTDEPSQRGIEGEERMRLVREDISRRVIALLVEVTGQAPGHAERHASTKDDLAQQ